MMNAKQDTLTAGTERLNGLQGWWGISMPGDSGTMTTQIKRLEQFAEDVQKTCGDAYSGEIGALFNSNDRAVRSFQELLRSRRPHEVLAAESEILATFLESASQQAKRWAELTQKLQECSAGMAHDAAANFRQQAQETNSAAGSGEPEQPAVKQIRKQSAIP